MTSYNTWSNQNRAISISFPTEMDQNATLTNYAPNYLHSDDPMGQSSQWLIFLEVW